MAKTQNKKSGGEMLPHNLEAEQSLLGCMLLDPKVQAEITSSLKEEDFHFESHKYLFSAMTDIIQQNKPLDFVTLVDALEKNGTLDKVGGLSYIANLSNTMPSTVNYKSYLDIVSRDSMMRKLIGGSMEIIDECKQSKDKDSALAFAEKTVFDISSTADTSDVVNIDKIIPDVMVKLDELSKNKTALRGIRTKYRGLDKLLDGLHKSDLIILAARPAVGKTSFAMNIVSNIATQGYNCAVFSLEMSKEQIVQRLLCSVANVSMEHASKGEMSKTEWLKISQAKETLYKSNIFIDDSAIITPQEVLSKCRRLKRKFGLDLIMIDYVQLMTAGRTRESDNRQQEITEISRNLKILAKEINVPVLALSQLSRAVETRKGRPQLSDLRESGAIEQDADIVMFIHRPDKGATEKELAEGKVKKNVAEIIVEKHRSGPTGVVELYFKGECTKFLNIDVETGEPEDEVKENNNERPAMDAGIATAKTEDKIVKSIDDEIF